MPVNPALTGKTQEHDTVMLEPTMDTSVSGHSRQSEDAL